VAARDAEAGKARRQAPRLVVEFRVAVLAHAAVIALPQQCGAIRVLARDAADEVVVQVEFAADEPVRPCRPVAQVEYAFVGPRPAQAERLRHFGPEARRRGRGTGMQPGEVDIAVAPDETRKPGILEADAAANTGFHAVPFLPVECGTAHARARRAATLASVG